MAASSEDVKPGLVRGLGLLDATTIVMGSMIGSGIFIVAADIARQTEAPGTDDAALGHHGSIDTDGCIQLWRAGRRHAQGRRAVRLSS